MSRYDRAPLARVTVTVPRAILRAADDRARREHRSRSWIVSEALRRLPPDHAAEARPSPYASGFEAARLDRLAEDLALTPEERVLAAAELARTAELARPRPRGCLVLTFETWEDYLAWKRTESLP